VLKAGLEGQNLASRLNQVGYRTDPLCVSQPPRPAVPSVLAGCRCLCLLQDSLPVHCL
jgi:hypothetical protein